MEWRLGDVKEDLQARFSLDQRSCHTVTKKTTRPAFQSSFYISNSLHMRDPRLVFTPRVDPEGPAIETARTKKETSWVNSLWQSSWPNSWS